MTPTPASSGSPGRFFACKRVVITGGLGFIGSNLAGALRECERCCAEVVSLPVHPALADADVDRVADAVIAWIRAGKP